MVQRCRRTATSLPVAYDKQRLRPAHSRHLDQTSSSFPRRRPAPPGWQTISAATRRFLSLLYKEVKYFSSYGRWLDLEWYLSHFCAGSGRVKGEASPSYAILPVERIRLIRQVMPDVRLIYLMRDPIARAWSHAKHNYRFREANFAAHTGEWETVSVRQWRENFGHAWPLTSCDYLGQPRRWLSVFPREQFYIGFYESIGNFPQKLMREIFAFSGVSPDVDWAGFPVTAKVLPGLSGELSTHLQRVLQQMLGERTRELASFLQE